MIRAEIIAKISSLIEYILSKFSLEIISLSFAIKIQLTTSIFERNAYLKNLTNSLLDCPVEPSAMFRFTESAALFICDVKIKSSSLGKYFVVLFTYDDSSKDFCQTRNCSNLNAILLILIKA